MGGCCCSARRGQWDRAGLGYQQVGSRILLSINSATLSISMTPFRVSSSECGVLNKKKLTNVGEFNAGCPWPPMEHDPFSVHHRLNASTNVLTDLNLEISDAGMLQAPRPPSIRLVCVTNNLLDPQAGEDMIVSGSPCVDLKGPVMKTLGESLSESPNFSEEKKSKLIEPVPFVDDEEDFCPTCLEEYGKENPKITTNCGHHFHLSCILEWMERSETCPICNQAMVFNEQGDL